jgi:protein TonB
LAPSAEPAAPSAFAGGPGSGSRAAGTIAGQPGGGAGAGGRAAAAGAPGDGRGGAGAAAGESGGGGALALAVPGDGGGDAAEYRAYLALVRRRIHELLTYPSAARHRGLSGTVQIEVEITVTGAVGNVTLASSSSHRLLDEAALDAARGIRRVPFPTNVRPRPLRVRLPVVFDLR